MKKQWLFGGLLLLVVAIVAILQFTGKEEETEQEVIKIGAILPLTGKYSDLGNWAKVGIALASEEIKKEKSNFRFEFYFEDAKSEAKGGISAYEKLTNLDNVDIVLTTSSVLSLAIKPKAIEDSILFFGIASHPELTMNNNGLVFRPCNTSVEEGELISQYIQRNIDENQKVWILYHNSEFGLSFNSQINEKLKGIVAGSASFEDKPETFKTIASKVTMQGPEMIAVIGFTPSLGFMIKALREMNYKGQIISNIGFSTPSVIEAAGDAAFGVNYIDYNLPDDSDYFIRLDSISRSNYKTNFSAISYLAYFTVKAIGDATKNEMTFNKEKVASFFRNPREINIHGIIMSTQLDGDILPALEVKKYDE